MTKTKKGYFVCIEGPDKSGKTTQSKLLVKALCRTGYDAVYTTEPSHGEIGNFIRSHVLSRTQRLSPVVEALLFAADRADHIEREIKPLLDEGKVVVSDRYVYSSLAYQGAAGLDINWIAKINRHALVPDLAICLDVPVGVIFQRCRGNRSVMELPEIQKRVREVYLRLIKEGKMISIDGSRPIDSVATDVQRLVLERLKKSKHMQAASP